MHTTDYFDTFIAVAEDCPVDAAEVPTAKSAPTIASLHHDLIAAAPYALTSDEVIFETFAIRSAIPDDERDAARGASSRRVSRVCAPRPWANATGGARTMTAKVGSPSFAVGTPEYERLAKDASLTQTRAMRSRRA